MVKEKKDTTLEIPEKQQDQFTYAEAVKSLVAQKKLELENLNHSVLLAKQKLSTTEQQCLRLDADFRQKMAKEKQDFEQLKVTKLNELAQREDVVRKLENNISQKLDVVKGREISLNSLEIEKKKTLEARINLEKLINSNKVDSDRLASYQQEAREKIAQISLREKNAEEKLNKAKEIDSGNSFKLEKISQIEKSILSEKENIEKIRKDIEPRIAELEKLTKDNTKILDETKKRESNILTKIEENKVLLAKISENQRALQVREIDVATREEEVKRKEIILANK